MGCPLLADDAEEDGDEDEAALPCEDDDPPENPNPAPDECDDPADALPECEDEPPVEESDELVCEPALSFRPP